MIPHFVQDVVGHISGMPGIFISCVFSASLSTVSATLNSFAGVFYGHYIRPLKLFQHNDRNANRFMKLTIVVVGTYSVLGGIVVEKSSSIFQAMNVIVGMFIGPTFGAFTIGMLYPWANRHVSLSLQFRIQTHLHRFILTGSDDWYNTKRGHHGWDYNKFPDS